MEGKSESMQTVFSKLSERNKDIVILIAKSMKIAQEEAEQSLKHQKEKCKCPDKTAKKCKNT